MNLFCEPPIDAVLSESVVTCIALAQVSPASASLRAAGEGLGLLFLRPVNIWHRQKLWGTTQKLVTGRKDKGDDVTGTDRPPPGTPLPLASSPHLAHNQLPHFPRCFLSELSLTSLARVTFHWHFIPPPSR